MKKIIAFAFITTIIISSVGCSSDGSRRCWNPFRRNDYPVNYCPMPAAYVDECCTPGCSPCVTSPTCDSCVTPELSGARYVEPAPI
ncbi:MAG: hypothetical protein Q4C96_01240 [Planctomycetia bacterium]|nr:hypothetical protein [Planctomycetia bacterium]